jgi:hypothetical protein
MTALRKKNLRLCFFRDLTDSVENGHVARRRSVVISFEGAAAVGVGADYRDFFHRFEIERQRAVVFKQNRRAARGFEV